MKHVAKLSLSFVCAASGAVASSGSFFNSSENLNNIPQNSTDNVVGQDIISKDNNVAGIQYARVNVLGGMVGGTNAAGTGQGGSKMDNCYSNCHSENPAVKCASQGYSRTSCPTDYALSQQCPVAGGGDFYKECILACHTESAADQCAELSPPRTTTICATGYTLSNQCTVAGGGAYYAGCTCHSDTVECTAALNTLKNAINAYRSSVPTCKDLGQSYACEVAANSLGGTNGSAVFSDCHSYSAYFLKNTTSGSFVTSYPSTSSLVSAVNTYNSSGCVPITGKAAFGGNISNCHDGNCDTYYQAVESAETTASNAMKGMVLLAVVDNNDGGIIKRLKELFAARDAYALCAAINCPYDQPDCCHANCVPCHTDCHTECHTEAATVYYKKFNYTMANSTGSVSAYCRTTSTLSTITISNCNSGGTSGSTMATYLGNITSAINTFTSAGCDAAPLAFYEYSCYSNYTPATCHTESLPVEESCVDVGCSDGYVCAGSPCKCAINKGQLQCAMR